MMMTTKMISLTVLVILFTSSIIPSTSEAAIVLQPGYPGYEAPRFSFSPRSGDGRSLFYRESPGVEKFRSPVHELYMRPYNYVSYSMGGSKPVQYNYQTHNSINQPYTPSYHSPRPLQYSTPVPVYQPTTLALPPPTTPPPPPPPPPPPSSPVPTPSASFTHHAVAVVRNAQISGVIHFSQNTPSGPVTVTGRVEGLTPGEHGFHIHQLGDTQAGCKSMKGHFNPLELSHGAPGDTYRHVGDLGNIRADQDGVAIIDMEDKLLSLTGINNILARGVVIHAGVDDMGKGGDDGSLKTGNAGGRVACAVIARSDGPQV